MGASVDGRGGRSGRVRRRPASGSSSSDGAGAGNSGSSVLYPNLSGQRAAEQQSQIQHRRDTRALGGGQGGGGGSGARALGSMANMTSGGGGSGGGGGEEGGFDAMNRVAANLLTHLTSSMRFPGDLNVDLNEITTNLVPFPNLHYLCPALAPLNLATASTSSPGGGVASGGARPRQAVVRQLFQDVYSRSHQLIRADPRSGTYLASALLVRGDISVSDVNSAMSKIQPSINNVHWNQEGFKVGFCSAAPLAHPHGLLCLANNSCISGTFAQQQDRFQKLYSRKAMRSE